MQSSSVKLQLVAFCEAYRDTIRHKIMRELINLFGHMTKQTVGGRLPGSSENCRWDEGAPRWYFQATARQPWGYRWGLCSSRAAVLVCHLNFSPTSPSAHVRVYALTSTFSYRQVINWNVFMLYYSGLLLMLDKLGRLQLSCKCSKWVVKDLHKF